MSGEVSAVDIWEELSFRAKRVVLRAHYEAQRGQVGAIEPRHVLLGILRVGEGGAIEVLKKCGADVAALLREARELCREEREESSAEGAETSPRTRRLLALARQQATQLGRAEVGTEHLLLGLLEMGEGRAFEMLCNHGLELPAARRAAADISG